MKIEAYSEQKKAAAMYREQQRQAAAVKGSVSGAAITQAVSFTKSDNSMELFGMSNYASEENYDSRPKTGEEFADEAQALSCLSYASEEADEEDSAVIGSGRVYKEESSETAVNSRWE